jgi:hypothetical protein
MPEPVTVWMVHLGDGGGANEKKGTLSLEEDAVVFAFADSLERERIPLAAAKKAKRVRGSPVLLLSWTQGERPRSTAFYFVQPPPLRPPGLDETDRPRPGFGMLGRPSKRRHQRTNVRYLQTMGGGHKPLIQAWAEELMMRIGRH